MKTTHYKIILKEYALVLGEDFTKGQANRLIQEIINLNEFVLALHEEDFALIKQE